jgi:hypothetical protein
MALAPYLMLFLLLLAVFGASSLLRVEADTCGTSPHYFAGGLDGDTYNDYGIAAEQTIHSQTVCGTSSNKSVVAVWSMDNWATGDFLFRMGTSLVNMEMVVGIPPVSATTTTKLFPVPIPSATYQAARVTIQQLQRQSRLPFKEV